MRSAWDLRTTPMWLGLTLEMYFFSANRFHLLGQEFDGLKSQEAQSA